MDSTVIAILYDFDKTLCPKDMQEYGFIPQLGMDSRSFWRQADALKQEGMDGILAYMYLMLKKAKAAGRPITREDFKALGKDIDFFPGVSGWFDRVNAYGKSLHCEVRHYILSSGLSEIIEGTAIYPHFHRVFACSFHYDEKGAADWPAHAVNYTGKTQYLFRVNKGFLDMGDDVGVNRYLPDSERPVPFSHMIYLGDGLTDVPCMRLVKQNGGHAIALYQESSFDEVFLLLKESRVNFIAPADYRPGSVLEGYIQKIMGKIATDHRLYQIHRQLLNGKKPG